MEKIRLAGIGKKVSAETRKKMSEAQHRRHANNIIPEKKNYE
jgi:hypothetical protein